nr:hypothetical protein [Tanacetum cinerariifolium]
MAQQTSPTATSSPSLPPVTTALIPIVTLTDTPQLRHYTRRARIAQSLPLPPVADELASLIRDVSQGMFKAKVKLLEDREGGGIAQYRDDAPIKGRSLDEGKEAAKKGISTGSGSIPTAGPLATGVPTGSDVVPTASLIFATATVVTPYTRRKRKEKMVESNTPKKKKLQEYIDVQVVRELEEQMAREDQRMSKQIARDAEIAKIHVEEEL